jgi:nicotinamide phosphoribosyltransferase
MKGLNKLSILDLCDSYKVSHYLQYPKGTEQIYSYFEARGGKFTESVFFGLQYILKSYFEGVQVRIEDIDRAEKMYAHHFGSTKVFNRKIWEHIIEKHGGKLPIRIKAVKEGTVVPIKNVLMVIENLDPECFWLTNYIETILQQVWYPTTVATLSREVKKIILSYLEETGTPESINFKLHDFGFRGCTSLEQCYIGSAAHLINFWGTDSIPAISMIEDYYNEELKNINAYSIPATEHSTITSHGRENEVEAYRQYIEANPDGIIACVSDSWDYLYACSDIYGKILKDLIMKRNGTFVIRPDSGNPIEMVIKSLDILTDPSRFGFTMVKGYKVLPPQVRMIWGDGIDIDGIREILQAMKENGYSADNIAFGMGGGLLQKVNRDTQQFAIKCSYAVVNGVPRDVFKDPVTSKSKKSKKGRLSLIDTNEGYQTVSEETMFEFNVIDAIDELVTVFENGNLLQDYKFSDVVERAKIVKVDNIVEEEVIFTGMTNPII